jgi:hypothetical protein
MEAPWTTMDYDRLRHPVYDAGVGQCEEPGGANDGVERWQHPVGIPPPGQ